MMSLTERLHGPSEMGLNVLLGEPSCIFFIKCPFPHSHSNHPSETPIITTCPANIASSLHPPKAFKFLKKIHIFSTSLTPKEEGRKMSMGGEEKEGTFMMRKRMRTSFYAKLFQ